MFALTTWSLAVLAECGVPHTVAHLPDMAQPSFIAETRLQHLNLKRSHRQIQTSGCSHFTEAFDHRLTRRLVNENIAFRFAIALYSLRDA